MAWTSPSSETGSSKSNISLPSLPLMGILVTTPIWHCFVNGWNRILVREWSTPEEQTSWAAGVRAYALRSLAHTSYSYGVGNLLALRLGLRLCCKHIQVMTTTFKRHVNQQKTMGKPGSNNKVAAVLRARLNLQVTPGAFISLSKHFLHVGPQVLATFCLPPPPQTSCVAFNMCASARNVIIPPHPRPVA